MNEKFKVEFIRTYVTTIYVDAASEEEALQLAEPMWAEAELEQMNVDDEDALVTLVDDAGRCADCAH
jgi:hypothetical protein